MLSLTLVLLSGTHCHSTIEMLQLSTPSSLLEKPVSSTSKNLISSYLPDLLCVGVCVCGVVCLCGECVCMCVCVDEREGERGERECVCATDVTVYRCTGV